MRYPRIGTPVVITALDEHSCFQNSKDVVVGMPGTYLGLSRKKNVRHKFSCRMVKFRANPLYLEMYKKEMSSERYVALRDGTVIAMTFAVIKPERGKKT